MSLSHEGELKESAQGALRQRVAWSCVSHFKEVVHESILTLQELIYAIEDLPLRHSFTCVLPSTLFGCILTQHAKCLVTRFIWLTVQ